MNQRKAGPVLKWAAADLISYGVNLHHHWAVPLNFTFTAHRFFTNSHTLANSLYLCGTAVHEPTCWPLTLSMFDVCSLGPKTHNTGKSEGNLNSGWKYVLSLLHCLSHAPTDDICGDRNREGRLFFVGLEWWEENSEGWWINELYIYAVIPLFLLHLPLFLCQPELVLWGGLILVGIVRYGRRQSDMLTPAPRWHMKQLFC